MEDQIRAEEALLETPLTCESCYQGMLIRIDHMKVRLPNGETSMREIVR